MSFFSSSFLFAVYEGCVLYHVVRTMYVVNICLLYFCKEMIFLFYFSLSQTVIQLHWKTFALETMDVYFPSNRVFERLFVLFRRCHHIIRSLHDVDEMNAYRTDHVCVSA
jgi:hypothetical protein